jgi:phospholipid/cholesterol/gamma-HCH transport system substrate-binding protein
METRANFILIGVFTLLAILGALGFFIWLASVQIDRQYATYGILFEDVSGLDASGDVLFNGISVGKVIGLRIYEEDPSQVFATVEIDSETPIRENTVAQLQSQGVTGVAYISLSGGTPGAAPLTAPEGSLPIIPSRRSTVQTLVEDAPDLLAEATVLLQQFQNLTGAENQAYVANILRNLDASSERLDAALNDFSQITDTVAEATAQITIFTERLEGIGDAVTNTLEGTDTTLAAATEAFDTARTVMEGSTGAITRAEELFAAGGTLIAEDIPPILDQVAQIASETALAVEDLRTRSGETLDGFSETAGLLNARLAELGPALAEASAAFTAVIEASDSFDALVDGDGTLLVTDARALVADTRAALATIEAGVLADLPTLMEDIRTAVASAATAVETVSADLAGLTDRFDPIATGTEEALAATTDLFTRSQTSLDALDTALVAAETTLGSADAAFAAATGVMETDLGPVLDDLRTAASQIGTAVAEVTDDIPQITGDLRALIARADTVVGQIQATVAASAPGIGDFTTTGLAEITRLSAEARGLVSSLDTLVRRIERDPAGLILDDRVPDYRR